MQAAEDVDEVLHSRILVLGVRWRRKAAGEDLLVGDDVGGPVEGVTAVIDSAAALGLLVDSAEELPLRRSHLWARGRTTRGGIEEETDYQGVAFGNKEAAEFVEPEGSVGVRRSCS